MEHKNPDQKRQIFLKPTRHLTILNMREGGKTNEPVLINRISLSLSLSLSFLISLSLALTLPPSLLNSPSTSLYPRLLSSKPLRVHPLMGTPVLLTRCKTKRLHLCVRVSRLYTPDSPESSDSYLLHPSRRKYNCSTHF